MKARYAAQTGWLCGIRDSMKRDEIIRTLKERESDWRAHGVTHAALFGSVARNEQRPDSDIDIATMFDYAGLKDYVASLFQGPVDVIDREALKPRLRPHAAAEAIYAF
jgi:predicted nucleotidyltransferase